MHEIIQEKRRLTKRQAVVGTLEDGGEKEDEGQKKGEDEHCMKESPIGQMARKGHLDLGQIQQASPAVLVLVPGTEIVMLLILGQRLICIVATTGCMSSNQGRRASSGIEGCEIRE